HHDSSVMAAAHAFRVCSIEARQRCHFRCVFTAAVCQRRFGEMCFSRGLVMRTVSRRHSLTARNGSMASSDEEMRMRRVVRALLYGLMLTLPVVGCHSSGHPAPSAANNVQSGAVKKYAVKG